VLPVQAGGWAVVTAEAWPAQFEAGKTYTIPLVVRQHGTHPVQVDGDVQATLRDPRGGHVQTVAAQATGVVGRYLLNLTFATPGQWTVEVAPGWFPPSTLIAQVSAPPQAHATGLPRGLWWSVIPLALAAGYATRRARRGMVWQIAVVALVAGVALALLFWSQTEDATAAPAPAEVGQLLFSAKGCVTCHLHAEVATTWSTEIGPNLTVYATDPRWLESWLKDPASVRPQTTMPNLSLKQEEIAALSAFLLAE
jgi:cytochrome c2